jgi:formamidopyrimidine-DNA glycosylase
VEAVRRRIEPFARGRTIIAAHVLRPRIARNGSAGQIEQFVTGRSITCVTRRAKNLLLHFDNATLRIHLRMTGDLLPCPDVRFFTISTRLILEFDKHDGVLFTDPRALGRVELLDAQGLEALDRSLGPEPLSPRFTPAWLEYAASRSRLPAKLFLTNQAVLAGIGNIYAAEILFAAGIHPARHVNRLSLARLQRLHAAIQEILQEAVQYAEITYTVPGRFHETTGFRLQVYGREGERCPRCEGRIHRIRQGARSTYFCPSCQH